MAYPFLLIPPFGLNAKDHEIGIVVYYTTFMVIFNAGWSTVQTAHLAMIPELFPSDDARESLTLIRNSMTAFANILGYVAALLAFTYGMLEIFITYCLRLPYFGLKTLN